MKKLLSILLAITVLLCTGLLPAYAIENKDDDRIDIGEIFGYYHTVTFVEGDNESTESFEDNKEIIYPTLTPQRDCDYVWSFSENEYSTVPALMPEEDITVYAYKFPYVGFENYPENYIDSSDALDISTDYAYNDDGTKSLKYSNLSATEKRENSIALGNIAAGTAYKISFKYYIPASLNASYYLDPFTGQADILAEENVLDYPHSRFAISQNTETGAWLDGAIYFTADENAINDFSYTYLWLKASEYNNNDTIYFDHITTEKMVTADFIISDKVVLHSTNGVLKDNVFTIYYASASELTAPTVLTSDGSPVMWADANGNIATEFVAGGVYTLKLDLKGDLNTDAAVDTTDLAILKRYLVEIDEEINFDNADINSNGKVDITDLAFLKLHLAGAIEQL